MKTVKCFIVLMLIMSIGCTSYVKIYDGDPATKEKPATPILTVEGVPAKGELTFEKTVGEGESKETLKLTVKKEGGGLTSPFAWISKMVSNIVALVLRTVGGVAVPLGGG